MSRSQARAGQGEEGPSWLNSSLLGLHAEWLYYFAKLAEFGTIRRTARYLELTPQALSHVLTQLEKKTGSPLVKREGNRYVLTEAGQILLEQARLILQEFQAIFQQVPDLGAGQARQLSLGVTHAADFRLLAGALSRLRQLLPECLPGVWHLFPAKARAGLLTGEIEIGLFGEPAAEPGLSSRLVARSPYVIVGTGPAVAHWQELDFIACPPHPELHRFCDDWPAAYPRRISAISGDLARAALALCLSGQGALYLPRCQVEAELAAGRLHELAAPPEPRQHRCYLVWKGMRPLSRPAQALLDLFPEM